MHAADTSVSRGEDSEGGGASPPVAAAPAHQMNLFCLPLFRRVSSGLRLSLQRGSLEVENLKTTQDEEEEKADRTEGGLERGRGEGTTQGNCVFCRYIHTRIYMIETENERRTSSFPFRRDGRRHSAQEM